MTKNILIIVLEKLLKVSRRKKIKIVLMGGMATSIFARPRATFDIDGMVSIEDQDIKEFLNLLKKNGFKFDNNEPVKFIQGLPFISFYYPPYKTYVDLFIAKNRFQYEVLKRAKKISFDKLPLYIISPEDLILVKLQTGREKDVEDVREILIENKDKLSFSYLSKWAKLLSVDVFLKDELKSLGLYIKPSSKVV